MPTHRDMPPGFEQAAEKRAEVDAAGSALACNEPSYVVLPGHPPQISRRRIERVPARRSHGPAESALESALALLTAVRGPSCRRPSEGRRVRASECVAHVEFGESLKLMLAGGMCFGLPGAQLSA